PAFTGKTHLNIRFSGGPGFPQCITATANFRTEQHQPPPVRILIFRWTDRKPENLIMLIFPAPGPE
ncbi:hypothetical protein SOL39_06675, partial [Klebsiella aerogenes]|uniref:hypothetical protein n=1 Tax=Klebsiella aerogenes TaxID=548 RepID=UPI002A6AAB18